MKRISYAGAAEIAGILKAGGAYLPGDPVDAGGVTKLSYPLGGKDDPNSKIHPFKIHTGTQPYDPENGYLVTPHLFGKGGKHPKLARNRPHDDNRIGAFHVHAVQHLAWLPQLSPAQR